MKMPELKWNEVDFIECLGVLPEVEDYETEHLFRLVKDGLVLEMTIWQIESCVAVSIFKETGNNPFITCHFLVREAVVFINEKASAFLKFQDCVFVSSRFWMNRERRKSFDESTDFFDKKKFPSNLNIELHGFPGIEIRIY